MTRPSNARADELKGSLGQITVSNFFKIENYYHISQKVHDSFQETFQAVVTPTKPTANMTPLDYFNSDEYKTLDSAYLYGQRYCLFVLDGIATHQYYGVQKYKHLRLQHERQISKVLQQLQVIRDVMDQQELLVQELIREEQAREEAKKLLELQERAKQLTTTTTSSASASATTSSSTNVQESAMSKLDKLRQLSQPQQLSQQQQPLPPSLQPPPYPGDHRTIKRDPSGEEPSVPTTTRYRLLSESEEEEEEENDRLEEKKTNGFLPPPVPPPLAPPSYHQIANTRPRPTAPTKQPSKLAMRELKVLYQKAYTHTMFQGNIQIMGIDTYQGRLGQSTNGCTVISALVAARHLDGRDGVNGISDAGIVDVIDRQCGPLLRQIRGKLGLGGHALIIPSDVHDHLVDHKLLQQDYFEGVAGGNVMDPKHMGEFLKLLHVGDDGQGQRRRGAATFFFHEHVVSIVKTPQHNGVTYFDLVDSMPGLNSGGRSKSTRTRCVDLQSLQIYMNYYTSRKFSDANCNYIDRNKWDDAMADFDPRVFQGFVWSVKK